MDMVNNKTFIPSSVEAISTQRKQVKAIIESLLPACTKPGIETGAAFRAQAIIANPPVCEQAHVAEALGVPLHMFFTLPWTPTSEFPHPFALVKPPYSGKAKRYNIGKITPVPARGVRSTNFGKKAKIKMFFPKSGSQLMPPHYSRDFHWKDYCPMVFRKKKQN